MLARGSLRLKRRYHGGHVRFLKFTTNGSAKIRGNSARLKSPIFRKFKYFNELKLRNMICNSQLLFKHREVTRLDKISGR